jgi:hypothetical protein
MSAGGGAEAGLAPDVLAQQFGELGFQLSNAGCTAGDLAVRVGQVGFQRGAVWKVG